MRRGRRIIWNFEFEIISGETNHQLVIGEAESKCAFFCGCKKSGQGRYTSTEPREVIVVGRLLSC